MGVVNTDVSLSTSQENEETDIFWEWEHKFSAENLDKNIEGFLFSNERVTVHCVSRIVKYHFIVR